MDREKLDYLKVIVDFVKNSAVEYFEIHSYFEDYREKMNITIDLSNCINISIITFNGQLYISHNTMTSDKFCEEILINSTEHLKEILEKLKGGI